MDGLQEPTGSVHTPILRGAVLELLGVRPGGRWIDATIDGGGHAADVLAASAPDGLLLGIDRDAAMLDATRARFAGHVASGRLRLLHANFRALDRCAREQGFLPADGILFDLGLSSFHLDRSGRGFAFAGDEPLDMRFDPEAGGESAAGLLARAGAGELATILRAYGEERFASRIARTITARRRVAPLRRTRDLMLAIERSLPATARWRAARNAARVFQALRIAVNDELAAIGDALPRALATLARGGRVVVLSFHSLEDRIVKQCFRQAQAAGQVRLLTKKPLRPDVAEIAANPRSASAKLRAAERI
jgi:16S rRNA (cytosine1402-N4)-methyltransferase